MAKSNKKASKNAARVRAAQQQKRQRMQWSIGIVVLVVAAVVVLVLVKSSKGDSTTSYAATPAPTSISEDLAAVPLEAIAAAYAANPPQNPVKPNPNPADLAEGDKPEVLYIGAEFCQYCAGERWALNVALSKFGEFSDLQLITSSGLDVPTLAYVGSKYTSDHVVFNPIELQDQQGEPLEDATEEEMELFRTLGGGSFPFIDFGGKAFQQGGSVDIDVLIGKSQADIAAALAKSTASDTDPNSVPGSVNAAAGEFIRTICEQTGEQPADVCKAIPAA